VHRTLASCFASIALFACSAVHASAGVRLSGHVHALAQAAFDRGEVPGTLSLGLELVLRPTPAREQALRVLLAQQRDVQSLQYQRWLTPAEYSARFGVGADDLAALTNWLRAQGFRVGPLAAGGARLTFSGTAAQVASAFQTPIHYFDRDGRRHYANVAAPEVPSELATLIGGIRGLNDFHPHVAARLPRVPAAGFAASWPAPQWTNGYGQSYVGPADFAAIYDFAPLYAAGWRGAGVTIVIAAQSDYAPQIPQSYWQAFGVYSGQTMRAMTVPSGEDPGRTGDANEDEVYLDLEIAGGLAPAATLLVVSDRDAVTAAEFAVDEDLGAILNLSFSSCESADGVTNASIAALWSQAAAEGMTVVVSAGDAGDAACDAARSFTPGNAATGGLAVNGLASPPTALAVGGTDFNPSATEDWGTSNTVGTLSNALGYQPEMVWNDSCTNAIDAQEYGYANTLAFCNATTLPNVGANPYLQVTGSGGGLSRCSVQNPDGSCAGGYAAPAWQTGVVGLGGFAARALPDVSMLATSWLLCSYEAASTPCDPAQGRILVAGGTSAAAPAVAALLALLDESKVTPNLPDGRQGLVAPLLYALGALEYGSGTNPNAASLGACNSSRGAAIGANCVFHDITVGTNAMPCSVQYSAAGTCLGNGGDAYGIIEGAGGGAYAATPGYDLATGLGSLDAGQLVFALGAPGAPTGLLASAHADAVNLSWTPAARATSYDVYVGTATGQEAATPIATGITGNSTTVAGLAAGQRYYLTVTAVSPFGVSPASNEAEAMTAPAAPVGVQTADEAGSVTVSWQASAGANAYTVYEGPASSTPATAVVSATAATAYSLSGLEPGGAYAFAVAASNSAGASPESAPVTVIVPPATPAGLMATAGNGSVSLSWNSAPGANSYSVFVGAGSGNESASPLQTGIATTSTTVGGLTNGSTYYFRVAAVNAGGTSASSNESAATPKAPSGGGGALDASLLAVLLLAVAARQRTYH
jgi:fibronectin type 3 domain-containing protein